MFNRYTPHPLHQLIPFAMIIFAAIIAGAFPGGITMTVFIVTIIGAGATMLWIALAGKIREEGEYWTNIGNDIELLRKSDPDIWYALGFKEPPKSVHLEKETTGEEGGSVVLSQQNYDFGLSPAELQFMANELLSGKRTLAETDWKFTVVGSTRMRKIKKQMHTAGLVEQSHAGAATQGFIITVEGVKYLKKYASPWAIEMYDQRKSQITVVQTRDPLPPTESAATPKT